MFRRMDPLFSLFQIIAVKGACGVFRFRQALSVNC